MSLADELLEQAHHLVQREPPGQEKQASLRRAVSSAYYALFHLLTDDSVVALISSSSEIQNHIKRTFVHVDMYSLCKSFEATPPFATQVLLNPKQIELDLSVVARAFTELQTARHDADYNTSYLESPTNAQLKILSADQAFAAWARVKTCHNAEVFMAALLFQKRWAPVIKA